MLRGLFTLGTSKSYHRGDSGYSRSIDDLSFCHMVTDSGRGEAGAVWQEFFKALVLADLSTVQITLEHCFLSVIPLAADAFAGFVHVDVLILA